MLAYNHERFIRQSVESALTQQTDFIFEIVIGEDCSTDNTRAILQELARAHPARIRLRLREHNIGAGLNSVDTFAQCRGKYIAPLEGDDFWTSPEKLQRQVNYMDAHPSCSLCFHDATVVDADGRIISPHVSDVPPQPTYDVMSLLKYNPVPTCSAMYRRSMLPELPDTICRLRMQDWPTWLLLAARGSVAYLPFAGSAYRKHEGGVWSQLDTARQCGFVADFYRVIGALLAREQHPDAHVWSYEAFTREKEMLIHLIYALVQEGHWRRARTIVLRYLFKGPHRKWLPPRDEFTFFLRLLACLPSAPMRQNKKC